MKKKSISNTSRKLFTASMACVFMISLASCSNTNNNVTSKEIYATAGDQQVTKKDLWNEFQWSAKDVLETQIEKIALNDEIEKINIVLNSKNDFSKLSDSDKETIDCENQTELSKLYNKYKDRLVDYVVQDIYDLSYSNERYWDDLENYGETNITKMKAKYVDDMYLNHQVTTISGKTLSAVLEVASEDNQDAYFDISKNIPDLYVTSLAKELLAYDSKVSDVKDALDDDDDDEDSKYGYFNKSEYVAKFKKYYTNNYDLDLVMIKFNSTDEFNNTLRAFGLKIYNKKYYYISSEKLGLEKDATYEQYIKAYNDIKTTNIPDIGFCISDNLPSAMLDIFIQIYNYIYSGYRAKLSTSLTITTSLNDLENLKNVTKEIIDKYNAAENDKELYLNTVNKLLEDNKKATLKTSDELEEIGSGFKQYCYEKLTSSIDIDEDDSSKLCYSTSTQSYNSGEFLVYRFGDDAVEDKDKDFKDIYNSEMTSDEIFDDIIIAKNDAGEYLYKDKDGVSLFDTIQDYLTVDQLTENVISTALSDAIDDAKVKIYNEACEISYLVAHEDYSKVVSGAKNSNILATVKLNGKTWNLNINANDKDSKSVYKLVYNQEEDIVGTENFGVYNYLEETSGATTAIDILSKKLIKKTNAYKDTNENRDVYKNYISYILYSFANDGYSSQGYSSSIGKYNFLMLYFHTAKIDNIIDDYYRVQAASASLLTNYSSDSLISLFAQYTKSNYDNYFELSGTRLVAYFDADEDNEPDKIETWKNNMVELDGNQVTLEVAAKQLIYDVYQEMSANPDSHTDTITSLVSEIESSARAEYTLNPMLVENKWAKYRKLGLRVKTEEFTGKNSSTDIDFKLKQRLYDYVTNEKYELLINESAPSIFVEDITQANVAVDDDTIISTDDGYNLILVTSVAQKESAKFEEKDDKQGVYKDIYYLYNDEYIKVVDDVYNEDDCLSNDQIKLYVVEYAAANSSNLSPSQISSALSTFLSPVYTRYTNSETQRIILLNFIKAYTNSENDITNLLVFEDSNKPTDYLKNIIEINERITDDYIEIFDDLDTTHTANQYKDWWNNIEKSVNEFLMNDGGKE